MKKLALVVYPYFSMQEIASICSYFRWEEGVESETVVFSSTLDEVNSEEGLLIKPHKTFDEFEKSEYHCLILPGCSFPHDAIRDNLLLDFLTSFKDEKEFPIAAISAGPMFLAKAGLLKGKKFINSLFVESNIYYNFIEEENIVYKPVVIDGNIITAAGFAFNDFAIAVARYLDIETPDKIFTGGSLELRSDESFYKHHYNDEGLKWFLEHEKEFID